MESHTAQFADLDAIVFDDHAAPLSIVDNGQTVMVSFPAGSSIPVGGHAYTLKHLHFHHPAEEEVDGHKADMVIHLVYACPLDAWPIQPLHGRTVHQTR